MKKFLSTTEFLTGAFLGFVFTTIVFTFVLTMLYTPNILLEHSSFYKDGKYYRVVESEKLRKCKKI
jgi:hypothetical protein